MLKVIHISTECLLMIIGSKALDPVIPVLPSVVAETNSIIILPVNDFLNSFKIPVPLLSSSLTVSVVLLLLYSNILSTKIASWITFVLGVDLDRREHIHFLQLVMNCFFCCWGTASDSNSWLGGWFYIHYMSLTSNVLMRRYLKEELVLSQFFLHLHIHCEKFIFSNNTTPTRRLFNGIFLLFNIFCKVQLYIIQEDASFCPTFWRIFSCYFWIFFMSFSDASQ